MRRKGFVAIAVLVLPCMVVRSAADGFGRATTGGSGGSNVVVTSADEFSTYVTSPLPYTITVSGKLILAGNVRVASHKTIQGADSNATLSGDLYIGSGVSNVIVRSLDITNPSGVGDGDGITIINGARNIVVTHCTFTDCADGELDITNQSDSVTVSWCRFRYVALPAHRNVNLVGSSDATTADLGFLHATFHHCWYEQMCTERMPSVRFGRVHVYNNYFSAAGDNYCVRTRLYAECLVENNYFENVQNPWELLTTTGSTGKLRASGNNVAFMDTSHGVRWVSGWYAGQSLIEGTDSVFSPPYPYSLSAVEDVRDSVMRRAGNIGTESPDDVADVSAPALALEANYPNPFNAETNITFSLSRSADVSLSIIDLLGNVISTIVSGRLEQGTYVRRWNGGGCSSGVYFCRLRAGPFQATRRLILLR